MRDILIAMVRAKESGDIGFMSGSSSQVLYFALKEIFHMYVEKAVSGNA